MIGPEQITLLRRVSDLNFALGAGIRIDIADIDALEFAALRILRDEIGKYTPPAPPSPKWGKID